MDAGRVRTRASTTQGRAVEDEVTVPGISERDRAEVERSAAEAASTVLRPIEVDRYVNPSGDTSYPLEFAHYLLGDVRGKTVLDLGCGSGENLIPLIKRGANVIAIDISPELVDLSRRRVESYGLTATYAVRSAYETGLPDSSVDVVFSMSLLHHLDLPRASAEIRRILRPGGMFILKEPIRFSASMNRLRRLFPAPEVDISDYEHPMTREEIAVVSSGFNILAKRSFRLPMIPLFQKLKLRPKQLWSLDSWILRTFPGMEHFATSRVMCLQK